MVRSHQLDLATVASILAEAREHETEVLSTEVPTAAVIKKLGAVELQELDGSTIALGSLWKTKPAAVVFLRHYG